MPNDCLNRVTIYADEDAIKAIKSVGLRIPDLIPTELPETIRIYDYTLQAAGKGAIAFTLLSAWAPPTEMFGALMDVFSGITFIKNDWSEEGGAAGIWVADVEDSRRSIQEIIWDEGCIEERVHRFRE